MEMVQYPHLLQWPLKQAQGTHTHRSEKATEMGSAVTSDYPPATLTWRDWGHMNASVALSDI